jgi:hypothetical protein
MAVESANEREDRAARNQSMFRQINERLTRDDPLGGMTGSHVITCECADPACVQALAISAAEYEAMRREPRRFAVHPDHVYPDVERVVSRSRTFSVVQKIGQAGEVAESLEEMTKP